MLNVPVRLSIRRPSPTTVSYTVSNAPSRTSFSAQATFYVTIILRVLLAISALAVAVAKFTQVSGAQKVPGAQILFESTSLGTFSDGIATRFSWKIVFPAVAAIIYAVVQKGYTEESLLVIRGLGIQTSTSSSTYLSTAATRFIPTNEIRDIFIHEAFKGFEVRFYLAVVVRGEEDVVVVFPNLLPKRRMLEDLGSRHASQSAGISNVP
ncbi:hypothetical protein L228DRAFT_280528 [Xylona heveae TC161]|uniref:Phosphatidylinositol N-acetylglucosaminyltransferase subunit H conserved domain-containing protein n=1 Tax=Xylona heveae (strain CBS 132557 / TC161) TaxID=1328760 RepID=A0A165IRF7_XYLHT|nr:hypothetical protein L228DRAFT_280528 [Xylona heveae TC161]KZF25276.1 hypothetical protein L228DRAFT_280528 [Xylona heveae TC161]